MSFKLKGAGLRSQFCMSEKDFLANKIEITNECGRLEFAVPLRFYGCFALCGCGSSGQMC